MAVQSDADKRSTRRFPLTLPVAVKVKTAERKEIVSETRNVSARGVFFSMDAAPEEGSEVEFTLTLPPEITLTEALRIHCAGRVVRVSKDGNKFGIAAAIDKYDLSGDN
ncbi:MAG: PilZ domain-containing protein [Candidatus Koribacter versatilis]|uniref:PilZ domain-containing protein n=1 Tax=Candidatus Korobacter versatilis TaxID=658062 RepID=A0A932A9V5_9BACT|nr:PilZ domain-containing protein [Candidatus Koribacter versatilis]